MNKNWLFIALIICFAGFTAQAQRIAVVDVEQVLGSMEEYKQAQTELDKTTNEWQQEIVQKQDEIKGLYSKYQAESVLLSADAKQKREDEIMEKEKQVKELQRKKFGPDGLLFKKRQELVRPIQDKVYKAIEAFMNEKGFDFVFDKNAGGIIASNPTYDKTDDIIKKVTK